MINKKRNIFFVDRTVCEVCRDKIKILFFLPSKLHTQRFWFLEDTQGARFYDMHGTTLHLFVIYIVSRAIHEETFRVETRAF